MRTADYIFRTLADYGVKNVFLVTGGGAMFLDDAAGLEPRIKYVCNLHEQACAVAAEGYARISGQPGVICVTTGPGGTNALTGVAGAWLDSVPMLVISGQVKVSTTVASCPDSGLRQLGDQELNIVDVARPITKYAAMVTDPRNIRAELEKAWYICSHGRPGPVWLDIPLNVQSAEIDPETLPGYAAPEPAGIDAAAVKRIAEKLRTAERPVVIAGRGVRCAGAERLLIETAERLRLPVLTAISGIDLIPSDHPLFFGRPGILGARAANFVMQNSDFMLVIGTRMGLRQTGYAYDTVGRAAYKAMADIDPAELRKPTFRPDCGIAADAGDFLRALNAEIPELPERKPWLDYCREVRAAYPVILPEHRNRSDYVSSYFFPELLAEALPDDAVIVTGNGTAYTSTFQTVPLRRGMRMFANEGCASMGYGLPAAIGAAFAGGGRPVVCLTGDGSLQMNIQELQTLRNYALPVKVFVYNNAGYLSIKITQNSFFNGHLVGSSPESGVILPDLEKIAMAYGLPFFRLRNHTECAAKLPDITGIPGPAVIEVMTDPQEVLGPKAASRKLPDGTMVSAPLEDLAPFLPREEFYRRMLIPPVKDGF